MMILLLHHAHSIKIKVLRSRQKLVCQPFRLPLRSKVKSAMALYQKTFLRSYLYYVPSFMLLSQSERFPSFFAPISLTNNNYGPHAQQLKFNDGDKMHCHFKIHDRVIWLVHMLDFTIGIYSTPQNNVCTD